MVDNSESTKKFGISTVFTIGDVAVCISLIVTGFQIYNAIDKRVTLVESAQARLESDTKSNTLGIKVDVKDVQNAVQRLSTEVVTLRASVDHANATRDRTK